MPSSVVTSLLSLLRGVKSSGDGWTALCPSHEDHENSLSIAAGDDGRVLLKCFAGCSADAIVNALGIQLRDLFPQHEEQPSRNAPLTVARLATDKALPAEFLRSLGLRDRTDGVFIPYFEMNGWSV